MKRIFVSASLALSAVIAASACAQAADAVEEVVVTEPALGFYASLFAGAAFDPTLRNDWNPNFYERYNLDTGWLVGATVGARVWNWARVEGELSYQDLDPGTIEFVTNNVSSGEFPDTDPHDLSATYLMANVWADIPTGMPIAPYVGGGIGAAWLNFEGPWSSPAGFQDVDSDVAFAWQVCGGVQYDLTQDWAVDLGYRYKRVEDATVSAQPGAEMESTFYTHNVQLGILRRF
jgi:opacity protein-like surface antigen